MEVSMHHPLFILVLACFSIYSASIVELTVNERAGINRMA
jgi:hypothetical protein